LVVAFNAGLHQLATEWIPTVQFLLEQHIPCIFTSYNREEAMSDAEHLGQMGAKILWKEEWNRWTGQRVKSPSEGDKCRFENAFWLGFQGLASE
jgi:hypothetical protein